LLLRRRLAADADVWRTAHTGYVTYYTHAQDPVARHHHQLALVDPSHTAELAAVVTYLEREYEQVPVGEWLRLLHAVTRAPHRLRTTGEQRDVATALAGHAADGDGRRAAIALLTVAHWLYNDRYFDPCHRLAHTVADAYNRLAGLSVGRGELLFQESGRYRHIERRWEY
jgi:hypothetical protein